jgi:hypothetical protein
MRNYESNQLKAGLENGASACKKHRNPACNNATPEPSKFLPETELARRWHVSVKVLQKWRTNGRGPRFCKFGSAVRYSVSDIEEFEASVARNNTSETKGGDNV